ncbi:MAG: hypothetical protein NVSMB1_19240 [Polyangiales bacterium]
MVRSIVCLFGVCGCLSAVACSSLAPVEQNHSGKGEITSTVPQLELTSTTALSISRSFPPSTEINIAVGNLACEVLDATDRLTIDIGDSKLGTYDVVKGFP